MRSPESAVADTIEYLEFVTKHLSDKDYKTYLEELQNEIEDRIHCLNEFIKDKDHV